MHCLNVTHKLDGRIRDHYYIMYIVKMRGFCKE